MTAITLATYSDLLSLLSTSGGFLHRTDTADILPICVQMCETTINLGNGDDIDGLRTAAQETTTTLTCSAGVQTVALPTNYLEIRFARINFSGITRQLKFRPVTPISTTQQAFVRSIPQTAWIQGSSLYLDPIPDQAYTITLDYYASVGPLATQGTNWLLTAAPMLYLGGTVLHGAPWFGRTFDPTPWANMFSVGMKQVTSGDSSRFSNVTLRSEAAQMVGGGYGYAQFLSGA